MLHGSRIGVLLDAEAVKDAHREEVLSLATAPAELVRVPGGLAGEVVKVGVVNEVTEWLEDKFASNEAQALTAERQAIEARYLEVANDIDEVFEALLEAGHLTEGSTSLRRDLLSSYRDTTAGWSERARTNGLFR